MKNVDKITSKRKLRIGFGREEYLSNEYVIFMLSIKIKCDAKFDRNLNFSKNLVKNTYFLTIRLIE